MSQLDKLLREAVALEQELKAMDMPRARKLQAHSFVRRALEVAGISRQRAQEMHAQLDESEFKHVRAALRRMTKMIAEPTWVCPPRDPARLNHLISDAARGELAAIGMTPFHLHAVAAMVTAKERPQSFGTCSDMEAHAKRLSELLQRRDQLRELIEQRYGPDDLVLTEAPTALRDEGYVKAAFKLSNGAVSIGPKAGERLINWAAAAGWSS